MHDFRRRKPLVFCPVCSLFLATIFFATHGKLTFHHKPKASLFLALSGIAMGTSWMFLYEAYARLGVSIASLCYYCGPVIVMVLSPLLFREKLTAQKIIGFLAVFVGIFLVNGQEGSLSSPFGLFCGLASAVTYAAMVICNKKAADITGLENAVLQLFTAFVTVAIFVIAKQGFTLTLPTDSIFPMGILGLVNTGIGCYLYFSSIGHLPAQTVALCGYLEALSAVFFSMVFLKEVLGLWQILGAVLIIGGAMFGNGMRRKG